jgi:hypothetical protein
MRIKGLFLMRTIGMRLPSPGIIAPWPKLGGFGQCCPAWRTVSATGPPTAVALEEMQHVNLTSRGFRMLTTAR